MVSGHCGEVPFIGQACVGNVHADACRCQGCSGHVMQVSADVIRGGCTVSSGVYSYQTGEYCACDSRLCEIPVENRGV